ncbi:MAG: hypothetical protein R3C18_26900 [Planctomycetaceae bacterium]
MKTIVVSKSPMIGIASGILGVSLFLLGVMASFAKNDELAPTISKICMVLGGTLLTLSVILFRNRSVALILSKDGLVMKQFGVTLDWHCIKRAHLYYPYRELDSATAGMLTVLSRGAAANYAMLAITLTNEGIQKFGRGQFVATYHRSLMKPHHDVLIPIHSLNFHPFTSRAFREPAELVDEIQRRIQVCRHQ